MLLIQRLFKFCTLRLELKVMVQNSKVGSACNFSSEALYLPTPQKETNSAAAVSKLIAHTYCFCYDLKF